MKACKNCKHFESPIFCNLFKNGFDYVEGVESFALVDDVRKDRKKCGQEAKYFKPVEYKGFFEWIKQLRNA